MTLPGDQAFLAEQRLHLIGMERPRDGAKYAARFPTDRAMTDLDCWDAFERDNPHTFETMYRFWVQAPAA